MDQQLIQRTRYLLRARFRRAQTCPDAMFVDSCKQLIGWITNHRLLKPVITELSEMKGDHVDCISKIISEAPENARGGYDPCKYSVTTNLNHSSVCYNLVKEISELGKLNESQQQFVISCLGEHLNGDIQINFEQAITVLRDVALDGLYEYLDEHLDERNAIYSILTKYKQRSEWFRKSRLRHYAVNGLEGKTGEKALALDVQEYVLDQGVEFFIEPASASGETDLILKSSEGRYIVIDAKYIKDESNRSSIKKKLSDGFHQVARYCNDFNVSEGFLVNFIADSKRLSLDLDILDGLSYLKVGSKIIYYIEINIANEPSASKSGKAEKIELSKEDLITSIDKERN